MHSSSRSPRNISTYAWLSVVAAIATIALKYTAYEITGSVSLLSDAMESVVNLVAAIVAVISLKLAAQPANARYTFGRAKAEYFSAALEGAMIFGAAALIIFSAIGRILHPAPVESIGLGILVSLVAGLINLATGLVLFRAGRRYHSPSLTADAHHLFTDIVTSLGVIIGVGLVALTHWVYLDPIVAIIVALNIIYVGIGLMRDALAGLMDVALPDSENQTIVAILAAHSHPRMIAFHGLQTRVSGHQRFIKFDALVPDSWTVKKGHDFAEMLVTQIKEALDDAVVTVHVEPINDPESYKDIPQGFIPLED
ncbi:cation diffusion facilitator family transporter [Arcanobacterium buesumense]|uniref:Cation transporter n=1 Tax=Arcanobacterium buesumense TaxID=2722751 RepID=A0A6H2ENK3_9ACTO|nr:cation diffusion facilitator family transporter [Arcanobacterium buesumense]QJC22658.1 cation transporter [Arcanobacterium buesumense]